MDENGIGSWYVCWTTFFLKSRSQIDALQDHGRVHRQGRERATIQHLERRPGESGVTVEEGTNPFSRTHLVPCGTCSQWGCGDGMPEQDASCFLKLEPVLKVCPRQHRAQYMDSDRLASWICGRTVRRESTSHPRELKYTMIYPLAVRGTPMKGRHHWLVRSPADSGACLPTISRHATRPELGPWAGGPGGSL